MLPRCLTKRFHAQRRLAPYRLPFVRGTQRSSHHARMRYTSAWDACVWYVFMAAVAMVGKPVVLAPWWMPTLGACERIQRIRRTRPNTHMDSCEVIKKLLTEHAYLLSYQHYRSVNESRGECALISRAMWRGGRGNMHAACENPNGRNHASGRTRASLSNHRIWHVS